MTDTNQLQLALERIARMDYAGVPDEQIAAACNIAVKQLDTLRATEKYNAQMAEIVAEDFDKQQVLNGGWDMVENLAMNKVVDHLQRVPDPDYALRAAALANKAVRRGKTQGETIAFQPGQQAIINVSLNFADKLQSDYTAKQTDLSVIKKKDNNFLPPRAVTQMLQKMKNPVQSVEDELNAIGFPSMA